MKREPTTFRQLAAYYDLIYASKDYAAEAAAVSAVIGPPDTAREILDLGCGTGNHDREFARLGYRVTAIDRSPEMLEIAREKCAAYAAQISFRRGDITGFRLGKRFDAVVCLFHVFSYLIENRDIRTFLSAVRRHLTPEGLFVMDFWHGPGVFSDRPEVRSARFETSDYLLDRTKTPSMHPLTDTVTVDHTLDVTDRQTGTRQTYRERHVMRYFSYPEVAYYLEEAGLTVVKTGDVERGFAPVGERDWSAAMVARRSDKPAA